MNTGSFYRALLEAEVHFGDIRNISIDTYHSDFVYKAYEEIGISKNNTNLIFAEEHWGEENYYYELLDFHSKNYYSGKVKSCITSISEVWYRLQEMGIPCVRVLPTPYSVMDAYNKLYIKYIELANAQTDIAVLAIHIDMPNYYSLRSNDEYRELIHKQEVARQISLFASRIDGAVAESDGCNFLVFADRKAIEIETSYFQDIYLANLLSSSKSPDISMGIGFGKNVKEAKFNAYIGVSRANKVRESVAYVVYDEKNIRGPINIERQRTEKYDKNLEQFLIKMEMGRKSASKLAEVLLKNRKNEFTTKELAEMCGMSKRNMDRIVRKLEDVGFCQVIGEQNAMAAGRPARLIRFLYDMEEKINEEKE